MIIVSEEDGGKGREVASMVDREIFRKVVGQRQKMKAELKELKEKVSALPQDWEQRLPGWLERDQGDEGKVPDGADVPVNKGDEVEMAPENPIGNEAPVNTTAEPDDLSAVLEGTEPDQSGAAPDWRDKESEYQRTIAELTLAGMIREAARKMGAYDPQDVVDLTRGLFSAAYENGAVTVSPGPALQGMAAGAYLPENGEEFALERVVSAFLKTKPHLVRASFTPGSGLIPGPRNLLGNQSPDGGDPAKSMLTQRLRLQNRLD